MSGEIAPITKAGKAIGLMSQGGAAGLMPFSAPILLVERTHVAGTTHIENILELTSDLAAGDELAFRREPGNAHDKWAIIVQNPHGKQIGYVPADVNEVLARLMDAGKRVYGKTVGVEQHGSWTKVVMDVYMED